jgi:hypothetical protein
MRLKVILVFLVPLVKPSTREVNTKLTLRVFVDMCGQSDSIDRLVHLGELRAAQSIINRSPPKQTNATDSSEQQSDTLIAPSQPPPCTYMLTSIWIEPYDRLPILSTYTYYPHKDAHVDLDGAQGGLELYLQELGAGAHDVVERQAQTAGDDGGGRGEAELSWFCRGVWVGVVVSMNHTSACRPDRVGSIDQACTSKTHKARRSGYPPNRSTKPSTPNTLKTTHLDGLAQVVDGLPYHEQQGEVTHGRDQLIAGGPLPQFLQGLLLGCVVLGLWDGFDGWVQLLIDRSHCEND